jgi:hypothetical protein
MDLDDLDRFATSLDGVRRRSRGGLLRWDRGGRLVARQLDETHVVVRAAFDTRDVLLHQFPETFSVPRRFAKHMMVVADLAGGSADAVEEAVTSAWALQGGGR